MSLTVLTLAKNEERNIRACLETVQFADEIIVVDDESTDRTAEIAREMGAKVVQWKMAGNFAGLFNYGLEHATCDWILQVDADERVTPELRGAVLEAIKSNEKVGYKVNHLNMVMGDPLHHGGWYSPVLRLFPRGTMHMEGYIHPATVHSLPLKTLKGHYIHYPYPTWEKYFNKFNVYTKLSAEKYAKEGKKASFLGDIIIRPYFAFFKMYILKSGWRDGKIGFVLAVFHFFYTMAKYVRLYYLDKEIKS